MNFDEIINRKGTYCIQWDYIRDRFGEDDLLPFTISDMDFKSPDIIRETLTKRLEHGVFGYSRWEHDDFRNSIVSWFQRRFNSKIDKEWVAYTPSVIFMVSYFLRKYSNEGDGILIHIPSYDGFFKVIEGNNRKMIANELIRTDGHYTIDFELFEKQCQQSKIFILCNPHNPTGRVWTKEEIQKMIDICHRYQVFIISDEIHMDINYNRNHVPILSLTTDNVVLISSPAKTFNIPSIANAYVIIPKQDMLNKYKYSLEKEYSLSYPNILGILTTMCVYHNGEAWLDEVLLYLKSNLEFVKNYLQENLPMLQMEIPEACYFAWIDCSALGLSTDELQQLLVKKGKLAIMSGEVYGAENFLRLNVACPRSKLEEGLKRLKHAITT